LAAHLGVSDRHLQRLFRRCLDTTPQAWLDCLRLQAARRLLPRAASVKEVAYELGFRRPFHFSRKFKERYGHSPSALLQTGTGLEGLLLHRGAQTSVAQKST
jgi:AraC-like DNA-binding protein